MLHRFMQPVWKGRLVLAACLLSAALTSTAESIESPSESIPAGRFESVLPPAPGISQVSVSAFRMDRMPVTNGQFARFVRKHPEWRRDRIPPLFADRGYLSHWSSSTEPGPSIGNAPVVRVSWFAARAYCEARGARLPTWHEWEYVAAASDSSADARNDAAWRQQILSWYSRPSREPLPAVGRTPPNFYGVQDLHGVVWEWVEDIGGMLVSDDNRQQSEPDALKFCGPGALTMERKEDYAMLMRIALLSSMQARFTGGSTGFRCANDEDSP